MDAMLHRPVCILSSSDSRRLTTIADMNKIIRSAYGSQTEYMELTQDALAAWKTWNDELAAGKTVPPGMTPVDRVFLNTGHLMLADGDTLPPFELASIENANAMGLEGTQLITTDPAHIEIAIKKGFASAIDPFRRKDRSKTILGVLETTGGIAIADKACQFALHKAKTLGVQFVLDSLAGSMESLCYEGNQVIGIRTKDGIIHPAAMTILACGGWTPSLLPSLDCLC
jgi:sarcosine oxidase/L-pipecolate oxidase